MEGMFPRLLTLTAILFSYSLLFLHGQTNVNLATPNNTTINTIDVAYVSATVLSTAVGCTLQRPCNVRFGSSVYSIQTSALGTLAGGAGNVYVYIVNNGTSAIVTYGYGGTIAFSCPLPCIAQPGISQFPDDAIPLYKWTVASGAIDRTSGLDFRALLSTSTFLGRGGLVSSTTGGVTTARADTSVIALRVSVPSTSSTTCTAGTWAMSSTFYYLCVATNTWSRVGIATW